MLGIGVAGKCEFNRVGSVFLRLGDQQGVGFYSVGDELVILDEIDRCRACESTVEWDFRFLNQMGVDREFFLNAAEYGDAALVGFGDGSNSLPVLVVNLFIDAALTIEGDAFIGSKLVFKEKGGGIDGLEIFEAKGLDAADVNGIDACGWGYPNLDMGYGSAGVGIGDNFRYRQWNSKKAVLLHI